jgi:hypothetical protein
MSNILMNGLIYFKATAVNIFTDPTFISDIYIHTLILFTFLTCLFIFYIIKLSKNGFQHHIGEMLDNMKPNIDNINMGNLIKNKNFDINLKEFVNNSTIKKNIIDINFKNLIEKINDEDKFVKLNNQNITKTLIVINVLLWVFIISVVFLYNRVLNAHASCRFYNKINWMEELVQNTIVFSIIGGIELIFLNTIIIKFIPVEPSFITKYSLEQIKKKFYVPETTITSTSTSTSTNI